MAERKQAREQSINIETAVPLLVSEAETRRRYIDLSLKEAGWDDLQEGYHLEYPVTGMPKAPIHPARAILIMCYGAMMDCHWR